MTNHKTRLFWCSGYPGLSVHCLVPCCTASTRIGFCGRTTTLPVAGRSRWTKPMWLADTGTCPIPGGVNVRISCAEPWSGIGHPTRCPLAWSRPLTSRHRKDLWLNTSSPTPWCKRTKRRSARGCCNTMCEARCCRICPGPSAHQRYGTLLLFNAPVCIARIGEGWRRHTGSSGLKSGHAAVYSMKAAACPGRIASLPPDVRRPGAGSTLPRFVLILQLCVCLAPLLHPVSTDVEA